MNKRRARVHMRARTHTVETERERERYQRETPTTLHYCVRARSLVSATVPMCQRSHVACETLKSPLRISLRRVRSLSLALCLRACLQKKRKNEKKIGGICVGTLFLRVLFPRACVL